ncbi:hypothetical protein GCM10010387_22350 [Streptomyces inusitatus]|uniref:Uncharacterized protein n=1 Tax=Streptomyces inusitatus TaxID=68221 RepID=A0A918URI5_9ACTN|nr:hypothetical protein [Streptomyces inusitatus]GGZ28421.1 hypothetical protein GCM10010387_22350 [Streptomyces inusitatus]
MRSVQITGTGQLLELSRRLKAAGGPRLKQNLARRIRRAAEPLRDDLQSTVRGLAISSQGRRQGSRGGPSPTTRPLRATIAAAIRISVRTSGGAGARVWVDRDALPPDLRNMAATLNTGRIRHPVFGNRRRWVQQTTTPLWWETTIRRHTPRMTAEVARVLDDVRDQLT